jgi:hypothetical protein
LWDEIDWVQAWEAAPPFWIAASNGFDTDPMPELGSSRIAAGGFAMPPRISTQRRDCETASGLAAGPMRRSGSHG